VSAASFAERRSERSARPGSGGDRPILASRCSTLCASESRSKRSSSRIVPVSSISSIGGAAEAPAPVGTACVPLAEFISVAALAVPGLRVRRRVRQVIAQTRRSVVATSSISCITDPEVQLPTALTRCGCGIARIISGFFTEKNFRIWSGFPVRSVDRSRDIRHEVHPQKCQWRVSLLAEVKTQKLEAFW
jgi:hypothetical protein